MSETTVPNCTQELSNIWLVWYSDTFQTHIINLCVHNKNNKTNYATITENDKASAPVIWDVSGSHRTLRLDSTWMGDSFGAPGAAGMGLELRILMRYLEASGQG